ncbi:hypothetical protein L1987_07325 [Smallanthus sonchifolius]|uniref:Uncharacterized protein n=1 Tax=Smallanthus sonchifolius TaxID=185202 RepID=A0ACB9K0I2_9ASTR|nr:hypothetical protein L1987_07325 [Smallanthus sonchifolius]
MSIPQIANEAYAEASIATSSTAIVTNPCYSESSRLARSLDSTKVQVPVASQIDEDEALALKLQEQFAREDEEREKQKEKEAKFTIKDSKLAQEKRSEWIQALTDLGEDGDYLEKSSNKELYRAYMGQPGKLAKKKRAEEEEKAREKSRKVIALNKRTHEERKVMMDFLKARC